MASAGTVTIGIKMLDEQRADMKRYVSWEDHQALRQQLHDAKAQADEWEDRYWALLSKHGGTT